MIFGEESSFTQSILHQQSLKYDCYSYLKTELRKYINEFNQIINSQDPIFNLTAPQLAMSTQQDPQACTKCGCMPQDILMLSCSHDLCLNCASDRLAFQLKKNSFTNAISCQQCHEKTPLDSQSINVLKTMIKPTKTSGSSSQAQSRAYEPPYGQNLNKYQQQTKFERDQRNERSRLGEKIPEKYSYNKESNSYTPSNYERSSSDRNNFNNSANNTKSRVNTDLFQGVSGKKNCNEHQDQQILYFCFDCKCQCICPECVIHGKHKDHDVKTIRKSQPLIKAEVDKYIEKYENNIQKLLGKKSELDKQIRTLSQQNNLSKKQIQQGFDELRNKISQQERQLLSKCDQNLNDNLNELQKTSKNVVRKIDQLKSYSTSMNDISRKDEILFLNFYAKKYQQLQDEAKQPEIPTSQTQSLNNQSVISLVMDVSDQVSRIGFGSTPRITRRN